ncbi:MAG TPA: sialidase family protein, partial [Hanamia sp.]|nr:sialidase family protein [Hanamia sp.]
MKTNYTNSLKFRRVFVLFVLLFSFGKLFAQQSKAVPVFVSGNDGYKSFRIPAIVKAKNGDL